MNAPRTVAALYIDPRGPYPSLPGVDCWDEIRDARKYEGPHPVVAHPPCGPWGRLRHLYRGGEGDKSCAPRAVQQVRAYGGALEHPRYSKLWSHCGLPLPGAGIDEHGGYTIEVSQCDWGHVARKMTWLYCVGVPAEALTFPPPREPTHWVSGGRGRAGKKAKTTPVPPGIKICSAQQRRRTPPAFAEWLVMLARASDLTLRTATRRRKARCDYCSRHAVIWVEYTTNDYPRRRPVLVSVAACAQHESCPAFVSFVAREHTNVRRARSGAA